MLLGLRGHTILREVRECVGKQRLKWSRLRRRCGGFRGEDADRLSLPAVKDSEIGLGQIRDRAVFVADNDTYLNQPSGYGDRRRLGPSGPKL